MRPSRPPTLDELFERIESPGNHLLSGDAGAGKSLIAFEFLLRGMARGELAALFAEAAPERLLEQAADYGMDLERYVRSGQLQIFEYPEGMAAITASEQEHAALVSDLLGLIETQAISRVVFDPMTPLVRVGAAADPVRCRAVLRAFETVVAPRLVLLRSADAPALLRTCKDQVRSATSVHAPVFRGGPRKLTSTWIPEVPGESFATGFELRRGQGVVIATPGSEPSVRHDLVRPAPEADETVAETTFQTRTPRGKGNPSVLVIEPDTSRRASLRTQLQRCMAVHEAVGPSDGLARASAGAPDAVVIALEMPGMSGADCVRVLRKHGYNGIVLGVGDRLRRTNEVVEMLGAGIDACFSHPVDARVLRLTLLNLLRRTGVSGQAGFDEEVARTSRSPESGALPCTADLSVFCARVGREVMYARENDLPFVVLTMRLDASSRATIQDLAAVVSEQSRFPDLVYAGDQGVACLVVETPTSEALLRRVLERWPDVTPPAAEEYPFANQDSYLRKVREFVASRAGVRGERNPPPQRSAPAAEPVRQGLRAMAAAVGQSAPRPESAPEPAKEPTRPVTLSPQPTPVRPFQRRGAGGEQS